MVIYLMMLFTRSHPYQKGMTAMMHAARYGYLEVVVKLAELGVGLAAVNNVSTVFSFLSH